jgi:ATP/maltotriose-dependent transcriptional regulator MalT
LNLAEKSPTGPGPGSATSAVIRPRVIDEISAMTAFPISIASASPGFGKSIAIRQYLEGTDASWIRYGLTCEGATLLGFTQGLTEALLPIAPDLHSTLATAIRTGISSIDWIVSSIREHLHAYTGVIHIDDLHFAANNPEISRFLSTLIDRSPDHVHWILAGRNMMGFPLASWTAYDRMGRVIDETHLRFTHEEAVACAERILHQNDSAAVDEAFSVTQGWPAAFVLALRAIPKSHTLANLTDGSRKMIYSYLAEQVFAQLSDDQRRFLLDICFYKWIDLDLLAEDWEDVEKMVEDLRRYVPFLHIDSNALHCDGLFADFLQHQIALSGKQTLREALIRSGLKLEKSGRFSEALAAYIRANAKQATHDALLRYGVSLIESGRSDIVERALSLIDEEFPQSSQLTLLQAVMAARTADFSRGDALFERAIETAADEDERMQSRYRYALELIRRNRQKDHDRLATLIGELQESVDMNEKQGDTEGLVLGTLATGFAIVRRFTDAGNYAKRALHIADISSSPATRATLYHQASFVAFSSGDSKTAVSLSARALDLAKREGLHALVARCHSIRYSICMGFGYDPCGALADLDAMIEAATKAGDAFLAANALAGAYAIRTEAGESTRLDDLRTRIVENPAYGELSSSAVASADAMRAAWSGQFREALGHVLGTAEAQITDARRALRSAEVALYAAACGERDLASEVVTQSLALAVAAGQERPDDRRRFAITHTYAALALILLHQANRANTIISAAEIESREFGVLEKLVTRAGRAAYLWVQVADPIEPILAALDAAKLGGFAKLLRALPFPGQSASTSPLAVLTKAELAVLREIATGATNAMIAQRLGRSQNTINAHVVSILRKLNCHTRQDASKLARTHGLSI